MGARKVATYEDLLDLPPHTTGQILKGVLHVHPRPALPHVSVATGIGEELGPPFRRGRGGPGGWLTLDEPELHLGDDIVVPDFGGWRRERANADAFDGAFTVLAPDWVCEVLSPSTARLDRGDKLECTVAKACPMCGLWTLRCRRWRFCASTVQRIDSLPRLPVTPPCGPSHSMPLS